MKFTITIEDVSPNTATVICTNTPRKIDSNSKAFSLATKIGDFLVNQLKDGARITQDEDSQVTFQKTIDN